ncbi:alpha N-terminal protein [Salix suchowensis]|nr:alpha N-terminal protein [Salix suchowensis]
MHLVNTHPYRFRPLCHTQKPYKKSHLSLQTTIYCHPTRFHRHYTAAAIQSTMEAAGTDSDGREFKSPDEMWLEHTGDNNKKTQWYRDGVAYWEGVEASVNGVLGGYGHVNDADVKGSEGFLQTLIAELFVDGGIDRHLVALDCGSGIGRITKNLLIRYFNEVDLLEPVSHFLDAARESLLQENHMASDKHKATNFYCVPLQEFTPDVGRYDVIWVQWCIGHLTDDDFVSFFNRAKIGLKPGGFFVLKENLARSGFVLDKEDRSITRSDSYFKGLFSRCGLHLYNSREQKGLPKELFAVKMYALTTDIPKKVTKARSKVKANRPGIIK